LAELPPAATVTDAGTDRPAPVSVSVSVTDAAAGVAFVRVTVHVLELFGPRLLGVQLSDEINTAAVRLTVADFELPLYVAVIVEL
jgi:hypothetical protein